MRTFHLHLKRGLSAAQYERLAARLRAFRKAMAPVKGGGRNLIVAIDVTTGRRDAAEHFAERRVWAKKRELRGPDPVRVHVARIEDVTDNVTPSRPGPHMVRATITKEMYLTCLT